MLKHCLKTLPFLSSYFLRFWIESRKSESRKRRNGVTVRTGLFSNNVTSIFILQLGFVEDLHSKNRMSAPMTTLCINIFFVFNIVQCVFNHLIHNNI